MLFKQLRKNNLDPGKAYCIRCGTRRPDSKAKRATLRGEKSKRASLCGEKAERASLRGENAKRATFGRGNSKRASLRGEKAKRASLRGEALYMLVFAEKRCTCYSSWSKKMC